MTQHILTVVYLAARSKCSSRTHSSYITGYKPLEIWLRNTEVIRVETSCQLFVLINSFLPSQTTLKGKEKGKNIIFVTAPRHISHQLFNVFPPPPPVHVVL